MTIVAASGFGSNPMWYLTRSTAVVSFVLLTLSFAFGLAATKRSVASRYWPRFATQQMHRNLSLLGLAFLVVHIVTSIADAYVDIGWWSSIIPGISPYRTFWMALGTISSDLVIVLVVTSLVRHWMSLRAWRTIHFGAYALWPLAFLHFLGTGTDAAHGRWGVYLDVACLLALGAASATRWLTSDAPQGPVRSVRGSVR
jgi:sulfoxide reductase heme-binding subunit YedZ